MIRNQITTLCQTCGTAFTHVLSRKRLFCSQPCYGRSFVITDPEAHFWHGVQKTKTCWEWQRAIGTHGYGVYWDGTRFWTAQRYAYQLTYGVIPAGLHVLHQCDNRRCVNPSHLFLGTNIDNIHDRMQKGRPIGPKKIRIRLSTGNRQQSS